MSTTRTKSGGLWPAPVYQAQFDNGKIIRMSFWTPFNKPFNLERARGLFKSDPGNMVMGHVEHDVPGQPFVHFADPHFGGDPAPVPITGNARKRATIKEARLLIKDLLWAMEYDLRPAGDCGPTKQEAMRKARELIAA